MQEQEYDMLVRLCALPEVHLPDETCRAAGVRILRVLPADKGRVAEWIRGHFSEIWANEFEKAMSNTPVSAFVAVNRDKQIVGFACYDATCRDFFGPIGVDESCRGLHIGRELLLTALYNMREIGYAYAIIGWVGEHNRLFYANSCGAEPIANSFPGIFEDALFR